METVKQEFVPDAPDGTMEMVFTFNVVDLVGHDIVVFEDLYRDFDANGELADNERIAQHADINDVGQTVNVRDAGLADEAISEQPLSQTGGTGGIAAGAIAVAASVVAAAVCAARRKKMLR